MRRLLRQVRRLGLGLVVLIVGLLIEMLVFPWAGRATQLWLIRVWSRCSLAAAGIRLRVNFVEPAAPEQLHTGARLLVANHCSWLDILAINAVVPASFVAKSEIKSWPILGWLVSLAGTIFIDRGRRSALRVAGHQIQQSLAQGEAVAVFPEGTTNDMTTLLPFHSNLLHVAMNDQVSIVPLAISYRPAQAAGEGSGSEGLAREVCFVGETTFVSSILSVYGAPAIEAHLHVLPVVSGQSFPTRHALADALADNIALQLGLPGDRAQQAT